jgi:hypothetical protein
MARRRSIPARVAAATPGAAFSAYFGVADEVYPALCDRRPMDQPTLDFMAPGLTLADLDEFWVALARRCATDLALPWPPYLPAAEEYALDHPTIKEPR